MAVSTNQVFRFLDLPVEIRKLIYREVFKGSYIEIKFTHIEKYETEFQTDENLEVNLEEYWRRLCKVDVDNVGSALTATSHHVRSEALPILERSTVLVMRASVLDNYGHQYLETIDSQLLDRLHVRRFISTTNLTTEYEFPMLARYFKISRDSNSG
jgi:hypothetical protein